jgi:uncharacterized protein (TIGR03118 family)
MNLPLYKTSRLLLTGAAIICFIFLGGGCEKFFDPFGHDKNDKNPKSLKDFNQVNLVGNNDEYHPARIDTTLINAWGIAFSSGGVAWVSSQGGHVSVVYDRDGNMVRANVAIPSPNDTMGGNPTGQVLNMDTSSADFHLSNNAAGRFFFVGLDGILSGWNPAAGNKALVINHSPGAVYTGLAMAQNSSGTYYLYAANFSAGRIDVWDKNFDSVHLPFTDPALPSGYAPFNIQNVGGKLYVMYAKVAANGEEEKGQGLGFVTIYDANGVYEKRFASHGQLNAPWGVAWAPASFFKDDDAHPAILVGNFGDGRINAYSETGVFLGQLRSHGNPIEIEGLWAIMFPPSTSTIDPNRLYFAAGPDDEEEGLFGYIIK